MAQERLLDKKGTVRFFSEAPMENIEAKTNSALGVMDPATNKVAVSILMKGFAFEKDLMQEHFNENYLESDKYPKATFSGSYEDEIDLSQLGKVSRVIKGEFTLHGVKKMIEIPTEFNITETTVEVSNKFNIEIEDYDIKVPKLVIMNIAEIVEVTTNFKFTKPN
jgi:polyisoprenoid-binding protein YceI